MAKCPHCKEEITSLNYVANYSEVVSGTSSGTCDLDGGDPEVNDTDSNCSEEFEEGEYEYFCPDCDEQIYNLEELVSKENKLGNFPKKRGKKRSV